MTARRPVRSGRRPLVQGENSPYGVRHHRHLHQGHGLRGRLSGGLHPPKQDEPDLDSAPQLYIHPEECIDCGACVPVCPTNSIFVLEELPPDKAQFAEINAAYYRK